MNWAGKEERGYNEGDFEKIGQFISGVNSLTHLATLAITKRITGKNLDSDPKKELAAMSGPLSALGGVRVALSGFENALYNVELKFIAHAKPSEAELNLLGREFSSVKERLNRFETMAGPIKEQVDFEPVRAAAETTKATLIGLGVPIGIKRMYG